MISADRELAREALREKLLGLSDRDLALIEWRSRWVKTARPKQRMPKGDWWTVWLLMAGRGYGKTRPGAEETGFYAATHPGVRCAVIAPTHGDLRSVCFEGESGLLNVIPYETIKGGISQGYNKSNQSLTITTEGQDSLIVGYSATEPNRLRGPQFHFAWCDELAAWQYAQEAWDMLQMCLRLGEHPRIIATTTPRPIQLVRDLLAREGKDVVITRGSTYENRANLAPTFFKQLVQYEGTQLGRQEIHAEVIDPEESGIIKRSWLPLWSHKKPFPRFSYIVQSYDTAMTERTRDKKSGDPDFTACQTYGVFKPSPDHKPCAMLIDCWQDRLGYPELKDRIETEANTLFGPEGDGRKPDILVIENTGAGKSVRQDLSLKRSNIVEYNPGRADKLARLHLASPYAKNGSIWLPESEQFPGRPRTWTNQMLAQICAFSGEGSIPHDDHVDAFSQATKVMADMNLFTSGVVAFEEASPRERRRNPYAA